MATRAIDIPAVGPFDTHGDQTSTAQRWQRWKKRFEYYVVASGITDGKQKRALLLHLAGPDVQDKFETLTETGDDYDSAINKLDEHFKPQKNIAFERHVFRQARQESGETIESLVTRLRSLALSCEFGDQTEDFIRDHVIEKCCSNRLRRRFLRETDLTLNKLLTISRSFEIAEQQAAQIETVDRATSEINTLKFRHQNRKPGNKQYHPRKSKQADRGNKQDVICYRCGNSGHYGRNCELTKNHKCAKCGFIGHFPSMCKTKLDKSGKPVRQSRVNQVRPDPSADSRSTGAACAYASSSDDEYVFVLNQADKSDGQLNVHISSVPVKVLIDSGASVNIIDHHTWAKLADTGIRLQSCNKNIYSYGSNKPLELIGKFTADITAGQKSTSAEILVSAEGRVSLLSRQTAVTLGVLRIGPEVSCTMTSDKYGQLKTRHKECFTGLGKLKDFQLKIHVDKTVKPVAQPLRRLPYLVRKKVEDKLQQLLDDDVIEPVNGPAELVSPLVVVPKSNDDIRICVDMRRANEAVIRQRYAIPTVDEVLADLNGATVFSKLDLKWGSHQIELEPSSRDITTFVTHKGLFRYKRLMFGVSAAPEIYQHVIGQVLQGCKGVRNMSDDIITYGKGVEDHDRNLQKIIQRLSEHGLTLNPDKCEFGMDKLMFMGHVLSSKGVYPDTAKVEAVKQTREPTNASEVRSFLGLANYCSRYIADFATLAEPLRRLTRKSANWTWGKPQQNAFDKLKAQLSSDTVLAYFQQDAKTRLIVDASPVGLGLILAQQQRDGEYQPVLFASRALTDVEKRYSQTEKEALAVVWGCERCHLYLYGLEFELITDHKPLEVIYSARSKPSLRIERWVLRLQPYRFTTIYRPGPTNASDALSRLAIPAVRPKRNIAEEYVNFVTRYAVPKALKPTEIEQASDSDPEIQRLITAILGDKPENFPKPYRHVQTELSISGSLVLRGTRIVIPKQLRKHVLQLAHETHLGIVKTKQLLREKVWWPGIDKEIETLIRQCHACQTVGNSSSPEPMQPTMLPSGPWKELSLDILGPFPTREYIVAMMDYYSRYPEIAVMRTTTANHIISWMEDVFARHGYPEQVKTDNGPQFVSHDFQSYLANCGIQHRRVTPYWPQANGEIERFNRTILKGIRTAHSDGQNWASKLPSILLCYRTTPHSTTGKPPAELLFNRSLRNKLPQHSTQPPDYKEIGHTDRNRKEKTRQYADNRRRAIPHEVQPGDKVLLREVKVNKLSTNFKRTPFLVVNRKGNTVTLKNANGSTFKRNVSHVKVFHEDKECGIDNCKTDSCETDNDTDLESDTSPPSHALQPIVQPSVSLRTTRRGREVRLPRHLNDYVVN